MSGTNTSRLVLYKPNAADDINVGTDLNANLDLLDLNMNYRVCTSSTRPSSPYVGQSILETDTGKILFRTNSATWQEISTPGTQLSLNNTNNATLSSTGHAFQVGPTSGVNLIADNDSLVARNNGAASTLTLNGTGGNVTIGATGSTVTVPGTLVVGGQYFPVTMYRTTNLDRTSTTTFAADPVLQASLAANAVYLVEVSMSFGAVSAADIKTQWTVPSGATGNRTVLGPSSTASQTDADDINMRAGVHNYSTSVTYSGVRNSQSNLTLATETSIVTTTTAGTLSLDWAQVVSNATGTRMGSGSWMRVTRLG